MNKKRKWIKPSFTVFKETIRSGDSYGIEGVGSAASYAPGGPGLKSSSTSTTTTKSYN